MRTGATILFEGVLDGTPHPGVRPALPDDLPRILDLDVLASGVERTAFLSAWMAPAAGRWTVVLEQDGRLKAFATGRICRVGRKIGPIIAPDADCALGLARAVGRDGPHIIGVPERNHELIVAIGARGDRETFRTARMYRGSVPLGTGCEHAIATMELGSPAFMARALPQSFRVRHLSARSRRSLPSPPLRPRDSRSSSARLSSEMARRRASLLTGQPCKPTWIRDSRSAAEMPSLASKFHWNASLSVCDGEHFGGRD